MNLQQVRDGTDLLLKIFSIIALIAGGSWAYYQFVIVGTTAKNLQIAISIDVQPYSSSNRLLVIHAKPKNIGKVAVDLPKTGFTVTLRRFPADVASGPVDLSKLTEVAKTDILQRYPDGYMLEPGVEYDELFVIVTTPGQYAAEAVINMDASYEVDQTAIASVQ